MKDFILSHLPFYRWHPEIAIRVLPVVERLKEKKYRKILDVGSGSLGIAPYLGRDVVGLDNNFDGPSHHHLKPQKGLGEVLPFKDREFEASVTIDTLEHVEKKNRVKVISEMLRVSSNEVIIAVPVGVESQNQDRLLALKYQHTFDKEFNFFSEHEKFGLPEDSEIKDAIDTACESLNIKYRIETQDNESLKIRWNLMNGWITNNLVVDFFYRKILLLFIPILRNAFTGPYYRKIYFVTIK